MKNILKLFLLSCSIIFNFSYAQNLRTIVSSDFEGPNGSTNYGNGIAIQQAPGSSGAPVITNTQKLNGSSSVQFNGRSALVLTGTNLNLGNQDFSLKISAMPYGNQTPWSFIFYVNNGALMLSNGPSKNGGNLTLTVGGKEIVNNNINDGRWHSIEISRFNGSFNLNVDGRVVSAQASPNETVDLTGLVIGHLSDSRYIQNWDNSFIGWMDGFQLATSQQRPPQAPVAQSAAVQSAPNTANTSNYLNDKNIGACVAVVNWREQNGKPVSKELIAVRNKYGSRVQSVIQQAGACANSQGGLSSDCLKKKLSPADFSLFDGFDDGIQGVKAPQDPKKLPNYEVLSLAYCAPLMK